MLEFVRSHNPDGTIQIKGERQEPKFCLFITKPGNPNPVDVFNCKYAKETKTHSRRIKYAFNIKQVESISSSAAKKNREELVKYFGREFEGEKAFRSLDASIVKPKIREVKRILLWLKGRLEGTENDLELR